MHYAKWLRSNLFCIDLNYRGMVVLCCKICKIIWGFVQSHII